VCCGPTHFDPGFVGGWGVAIGAGGPAWVVANQNARSVLYDGVGNPLTLVVRMQPAPDFGNSNPTGIVVNSGSAFKVVDDACGSGPGAFLLGTEEGTITGWKGIAPPAAQNPHAHGAVEHSPPSRPDAANYTGLAITTGPTANFIYATD